MVGFLIKWLLNLVWTLSCDPDFISLMDAILSELAITVVYILLIRAFLEGMSALVSLSQRNRDAGRP